MSVRCIHFIDDINECFLVEQMFINYTMHVLDIICIRSNASPFDSKEFHMNYSIFNRAHGENFIKFHNEYYHGIPDNPFKQEDTYRNEINSITFKLHIVF